MKAARAKKNCRARWPTSIANSTAFSVHRNAAKQGVPSHPKPCAEYRPTNGLCICGQTAILLLASSAVYDSARKHSPCPLMTTTGRPRKPGVHVCLAAESPMAPKLSHLNPGFKVVYASIAMAEDVFLSHAPLRLYRGDRLTAIG